MSIEDPELLAEFVIESQEHLESVENELLVLESDQEAVDGDLVNKVFRAIHSIKGAAGFLGQQTLEVLAHREEEVLNRLRNHEIRPTRQVISTLLDATDRLKGLLDNIESSNGEDVSDHITALEALLQLETSSDVPAVAAPTATEPAPDAPPVAARPSSPAGHSARSSMTEPRAKGSLMP